MFEIRNEGSEAEIIMYDLIGQSFFEDTVTAKGVVDKLRSMGNVSLIKVRINSAGGSVFEGFTIFNALKQHEARVEVYVDGMALSIASVIALAGDEIIMAKNAMMMIHNPSNYVWGEASDLRKEADLLDKIKVNIVDAYHDRSGMPTSELHQLMDAETWFTAAEAKDKGLADTIGDEVKVEALGDVSRFKNTPETISNMVTGFAAADPTNHGGDAMPEPKKTPDTNTDTSQTPQNDVILTEEDLKKATSEARKNEANRVKRIVKICQNAGCPERADEFIENESSAGEVAEKLMTDDEVVQNMKQGSAGNELLNDREPIDGDSDGDDGKDGIDSQYKKEYGENRGWNEANGITLKSYVEGAEIIDGKTALVKDDPVFGGSFDFDEDE